MSDESSTPSPASDPYDWEALGRYLAGESTAAEANEIRQRLAENRADAELIARFDQALAGFAATRTADQIDVEAALEAVKARRDAIEVLPLRPTGKGARLPQPVRQWPVSGYAALAAGIVITIGVVLWARAQREGTGAPAFAAAQIIRTTVGQRDSMVLPDSSLVVLGPRSELHVAADFGQARREVELRGEAYFDVRHDDARPFVVRSGQAVIRDVGTVFTVRNTGQSARVVVTEGAVLLHGSADPADRGVVLHPGDIGILEPGAPIVAQRGGASEADLAWTRGRLLFRDAPLSEVAEALGRWYGVTLRTSDTSIASRHWNADIVSGDSLANVLRQLSLGFGADIERNGDTVTLKPFGSSRIK